MVYVQSGVWFIIVFIHDLVFFYGVVVDRHLFDDVCLRVESVKLYCLVENIGREKRCFFSVHTRIQHAEKIMMNDVVSRKCRHR